MYFANLIRRVSISKLREMIDNRESLWELAKEQDDFFSLRLAYKALKPIIKLEKATLETAMGFMYANYPLQFKILDTKKGNEWLRQQISEFKAELEKL